MLDDLGVSMMLVFAHSALYEEIMEKDLLPQKPMPISGVNVPL